MARRHRNCDNQCFNTYLDGVFRIEPGLGWGEWDVETVSIPLAVQVWRFFYATVFTDAQGNSCAYFLSGLVGMEWTKGVAQTDFEAAWPATSFPNVPAPWNQPLRSSRPFPNYGPNDSCDALIFTNEPRVVFSVDSVTAPCLSDFDTAQSILSDNFAAWKPFGTSCDSLLVPNWLGCDGTGTIQLMAHGFLNYTGGSGSIRFGPRGFNGRTDFTDGSWRTDRLVVLPHRLYPDVLDSYTGTQPPCGGPSQCPVGTVDIAVFQPCEDSAEPFMMLAEDYDALPGTGDTIKVGNVCYTLMGRGEVLASFFVPPPDLGSITRFEACDQCQPDQVSCAIMDSCIGAGSLNVPWPVYIAMGSPQTVRIGGRCWTFNRREDAIYDDIGLDDLGDPYPDCDACPEDDIVCLRACSPDTNPPIIRLNRSDFETIPGSGGVLRFASSCYAVVPNEAPGCQTSGITGVTPEMERFESCAACQTDCGPSTLCYRLALCDGTTPDDDHPGIIYVAADYIWTLPGCVQGQVTRFLINGRCYGGGTIVSTTEPTWCGSIICGGCLCEGDSGGPDVGPGGSVSPSFDFEGVR